MLQVESITLVSCSIKIHSLGAYRDKKFSSAWIVTLLWDSVSSSINCLGSWGSSLSGKKLWHPATEVAPLAPQSGLQRPVGTVDMPTRTHERSQARVTQPRHPWIPYLWKLWDRKCLLRQTTRLWVNLLHRNI